MRNVGEKTDRRKYKYKNKNKYRHKEKKGSGGIALGVALLSASGVAVKIVGLLYKIPITRLLGNDGMGYFGGAYTVYLLFYSISAAGIPTALSILVSRSEAVGNSRLTARIDTVATILFSSVGLALSLVLLAVASPISRAVGNPQANLAVLAIAPSVFFACAGGAIRGYFQGHQVMLPTALSQITEALGKLLIGVFLANYAIKKGYAPDKVAAFAILGITVGSACSMILLLFMKFRFCRRKRRVSDIFLDKDGKFALPSASSIAREIVRIALPVTLSSAVVSLSGIVDLATVMHRLRNIGYSADVANALYGNYSALAVALVNMPIVLIAPISTGLVPYVSESIERRDRGRVVSTVDNSLTVTSMIAVPAAFGLAMLSRPILTLLFEDGAASTAAPLLSLLAPSLIFIALANVSGSLLQAVDGLGVPLLSMSLGCAAKLVTSYFAIGRFGIAGTPVGTFVCYVLITAVNFTFLSVKTCHLPPFSRLFLKPILSGVISSLSAAIAYKLFAPMLGANIGVLIAILLAVIAYFAACVLLGSLRELGLRKMPLVRRSQGEL